ncbi:PD40 domain-containing protein [Arthrobacter sp. NEB 688]|uniref:PD40 domain-containing protein n=1 Tax=Arthrobacter sp. NEB 688 TaxID=904039 RepID=UPI0015634E67|nr:PD40 domain-containing protein [Arthrobacter sp. NEB 688]QKE85230.1 hypothetical protein HL663_15640 [Arthrobacter sp. NEB 688]
MDALTETMRRAAEDAPVDLGARGAADVTWRRGRRRRLGSRAAAAGTLLALVLVVAGVVLAPTGLPRAALPAAEGRPGGVGSYPQRIGPQWWVRDLPAAGTPVALLVRSGDPGSGGWQAVDASGTRYRLPGVGAEMWPSLSPDGTRVGFVGAGDRGLYRVLDLRTGGHTDYPDVGSGVQGRDGLLVSGRRYGVAFQSPGTFSPDGSRVAVPVSTATGASRVLVLGSGGDVSVVTGMDQPAGWLDADRLLGRLVGQTDTVASGPTVDLVVWDRRTGRTTAFGTVRLHEVAAGSEQVPFGQWWGSIRGDGTLWLRGSDDRDGGDGSLSSTWWVEGFALPGLEPVDLGGRPVERPTPVEVPDQMVQGTGWARDRLFGGTDVTGLTVMAGEGSGSRPVVDVGGLDWTTAVWAQDALDGGPTWSPFGTSTSWVAWRWKELALAVLALALWRFGWRRRRRGRR